VTNSLKKVAVVELPERGKDSRQDEGGGLLTHGAARLHRIGLRERHGTHRTLTTLSLLTRLSCSSTIGDHYPDSLAAQLGCVARWGVVGVQESSGKTCPPPARASTPAGVRTSDRASRE